MAANTKICRCLSNIFHKRVFLLIICLCCGIQHAHTQSTLTTTPAAATTTPAATTTTEAATTTTTQAPTTTTTLPPTTTIAPNEPRTSIGETIIGQCLCDLTGNECDINCCCDSDCSDVDKTAFTCDPTHVVFDNRKCYQKNIFLFSNSPATTETTDDGAFCIYYDNYEERNFYLDPDFIQDFPTFEAYMDKYSDPSLQQPGSYPSPAYRLDSKYTAGDPIFVVYPDESVGNMVLPTTLGSNVCNDQNTIGYLSEATTQCTRDVGTLSLQTCTGTPGINAATYFANFRVVRTPGLFGYVVNGTFVAITTPAPPATAAPPATTAAPGTGGTGTTGTGTATTQAATTTAAPTTTPAPTTVNATQEQNISSTVNASQVQNLYDNDYTVVVDATSLQHLCKLANGSIVPCSFTNPPSPTYTPGTGTCGDVVLEARYVITTNGTFGIGVVQVQFVFGDAVQSNFPLAQGYSVTFNSAFDSAEAVERSGNPGYQLDKYLLYGELNQTATAEGVVQTIVTSPDPTLGLTVVRASATGECNPATSSRVPVRFGQNMRTGCLIRLAATTTTAGCEQLQRTIVETLEGPNTPEYDPAITTENRWIDNNRYVATFGNVPNYKVGDWVRIIVDGRTMPAQTGSEKCSLRTGLNIQILYANVGALANPQSKIVGVALIYDDFRDVSIRCTGAFCQSGTAGQTQAFEVTQTVSFVDVSQPAVKYQGEAPIFIAKVPNDFFYPFLYYSNAAPKVGATFARVGVSAVISLFVALCLGGWKWPLL